MTDGHGFPALPYPCRTICGDATFDSAVDVQFGTKKLAKIKAGKFKKLRLKAKTTESTAGRYLLAVDDAGTVVASTLLGVP